MADYKDLVERANRYSIDPIMEAYQQAARAQPNPDDRIYATPSDQAMMTLINSTNMRGVPGILQTALAAFRGHLGASLPRASTPPSYAVAPDAPFRLQPAPPADLRFITR